MKRGLGKEQRDSPTAKSAPLSTHEKALQINLDPAKYGTFAEIGAGQEVARWFFRVGGAAGTIAKSMSAYDMTVSDAVYGPCERYVSRQRLKTMLEYEFELLVQRLHTKRGGNTRFFVFADTVRARSFLPCDESHGWMGVRFQSEPGAAPSQIIIHIRMLDRENLQQQETIGIMGVNLIHGALYRHEDPEGIIPPLLDNLTRERVEVDMIKFAGPGFANADNRLMSLQLVKQGLTDAAMFTAKGDVVQAAEVLYKKPILVERGSFRPVTNVTFDMLQCGRAQFLQEPGVQGEDTVVLMEMTLKHLTDDGAISHRDFLDRADLLGSLGQTVLISNYGEFHRLAAYLFRHTKRKIGIVMGVPTLRELFEPKYYTDLEGGILEAFGRLFKNELKLYIYPHHASASSGIVTAENLQVSPNLRHLYAHLLENHFTESLRGYNETYLPISWRDVLARMEKCDTTWEQMVPGEVARIIKERKLFTYRDGSRRTRPATHARNGESHYETTPRPV